MQYSKVSAKELDEEEAAPLSGARSPRGSGLAAAQQESATEKDSLVEKEAEAEPAPRSSFMSSGMFIRLTILVAVTMQNTSYALVRRYSRGHLKERYSTSSALLVMELAKLLLSMWMVVFSGHASDVPSGNAISKYVWLIGHSWKMMVPAVICKSQAPTEPAGWTSTSACFRSAAALTLARSL